MCPAEEITWHPVNHCLPNVIHHLLLHPVVCLRFSLNRLTFVFIQINFQRKLYVTTVNEKLVSFAYTEGDPRNRRNGHKTHSKALACCRRGQLKVFPLFVRKGEKQVVEIYQGLVGPQRDFSP